MFGCRIRQNKFHDLLILMAIILQKQAVATVNSQVVETALSKTLKHYRAPAPLHTPGWLVRQNSCFVSLTL